MSLTRINGEPVKLVEKFEELREGMVVYGHCVRCDRYHRAILMGPLQCTGGRGREMRPTPPCVSIYPSRAISERDVAAGRVFRVIDEKLETESSEKARELERVR